MSLAQQTLEVLKLLFGIISRFFGVLCDIPFLGGSVGSYLVGMLALGAFGSFMVLNNSSDKSTDE